MKISVTDKNGGGIMLEFAAAIGASVDGRYFRIPQNKGGGYITGFSWGKDMRMLLRHYYLNEEILLDRTNELGEDQDDIVFVISGIFSSIVPAEVNLAAEIPNVLICRQAVSSLLTMPSNTAFSGITIAASRTYLRGVFSNLSHPAMRSILHSSEQFVFETGVSAQMISTATEMLDSPIPEMLERHYYRLKCEELLCQAIALLIQREENLMSNMHLEDIKSVYAVKISLQSNLDQPPNILSLARNSGMSEPKLRRLFKQTFGKGIFEYYQFMRMQEAARLLKGGRLTVSEVGYQLGFTNLSHFSRVFEQIIGAKPKKYAAANLQ